MILSIDRKEVTNNNGGYEHDGGINGWRGARYTGLCKCLYIWEKTKTR